MKRRARLLLLSLLFTVVALIGGALSAMEPSEMAANLCRSGGGWWQEVATITVENKSNVDFNPRLITLPTGSDERSKQTFDFSNFFIESIRVCDSNGVEQLFNIKDASGAYLDQGQVPSGSTFTFPATVAAGAKATYYVFASNQKAFKNLDRLEDARHAALNLDFEEGNGDVPNGWKFDVPDVKGAITWSDEEPFSGAKCARCEVESGEKASWIAARQGDVALTPGAKYRFSARVRGKGVVGRVGWYLHLGNAGTAMVSSPMLYVDGEGDFDWTEVSKEFTVADEIDRLEFGTVLYGTGTAWYDDAKLERLDEGLNDAPYSVTSGYWRRMPNPKLVHSPYKPISRQAERYATIKVVAREGGERLVMVDRRALEIRWSRSLSPNDFELIDVKGNQIRPEFFGDYAFFNAILEPDAINYLRLVEKELPNGDARKERRQSDAVANQAFPGTTLQSSGAEEERGANEAGNVSLELPEFVRKNNLLADGGFENVDPETLDAPKDAEGFGWTRDAAEPGVDYAIFNSGIEALGEKSLRVYVAESAPNRWRGWRRVAPVEPNQTYLIGYALATDCQAGAYDMYFHWLKEDRSLSSGGMSSLGKSTSGKTSWKLLNGFARASYDSKFLEIHLTNQTHGTAEYDSVFMTPVDVGEIVSFAGGKNGVFQVPAVAKVFSDSTFAANEPEINDGNPAVCSLARNEQETLQVAIRRNKYEIHGNFDQGSPFYYVFSSRPKLRGGDDELQSPEIFVVSNVLVDYPSNYYHDYGSPTTRKFPSGTPGCDGWIGYWPDPLIPICAKPIRSIKEDETRMFDGWRTFNDSERVEYYANQGQVDFMAGGTRALQVRVSTTSDTKPGVYEGTLTLSPMSPRAYARVRAKGENATDAIEIPYVVNVLDFEAPKTTITGIYDARISHDYFGEGTRREKLDRVAAKLLSSKLSSDQPVANLKINYDKSTGEATADWTDFDAAYSRYYDELGAQSGYFPGEFYLFGWGNPPKVVEGETPYPGEWPYEGADRSQLRPEYKRAYQAKLKLFWEHLKEKGWADKCVLYISDEPFYSKPEIIMQMQALCDMIHEVDPAIPIYSSTWVYVPEWLNYLDVWGVGHYGAVSEESLKTIRDAGGRIWWTTDGMMCLDTPLCAVERLLPYACVKHGAELYEFWGASWYTCNPFDSASHFYISQSDQPGVQYYIRYPNGDGYIFYPGELIGRPGEIIESVRSDQAREGIEDAGWLVGLQNAIAEKTAPDSPERKRAQQVLDRALNYLPLHCGSGRYSTRYIADPKEFEQIRLDVGLELEKLTGK